MMLLAHLAVFVTKLLDLGCAFSRRWLKLCALALLFVFALYRLSSIVLNLENRIANR